MRIGASLALIGFGAILAFAVTAHASFFNVQVAGYVCMAIGFIGLYLGRRGWIGRRMLARRTRPVRTTVVRNVPGYRRNRPGDSPAATQLSVRPEATTPAEGIHAVPAARTESVVVEEEYYED